MTDLPVFYEAFLVGTITVGEEGPSFDYARRWEATSEAFPASLRMPLGSGPFGPDILMPWLMNLLPEGDPLRTVGRNIGVAPEDVIGMLARVGRDTAGALSIGHPRAGENPGYREVPGPDALVRIIEELPRKPFLAGDEGVSMSLAGAQHKLPIALVEGRIAIPVNGAPSTHILKPDNAHLFGSVQNEALCMVIARRVGLSVAEVITGTAGDRAYLLVSRYDRFRRNGDWHRIHQEDLCQALGKPPAAKYEHNQSGIKGPSLKDFFDLARGVMAPGQAVPLLDAAVLNILLTNVDSHAKNYSLLFPFGRNRPGLAPLYDLMCGAAWADVTKNHAQDIGGQRDGRHIHARHWERMAKDCGLSATALLKRVRDLGEKVLSEIDPALEEVRTMPAGGHAMLDTFGEAIRQRCRTVLRNLRDDKRDTGQAEEPVSTSCEEDLGKPPSPS